MNDTMQQALESIGVDIQQTLARFAGNEMLLTRFLKKFPDDETFNRLTAAIDSGDVKAVFEQAHTLKGVAGNLGLGKVFDAVDPVVESARAGDLDTAKAAFPPVKLYYEEAVTVIRSIT